VTYPRWLLDRVAESQHALDEFLVATVTEPRLREPSRLPGWSRAHVLAHLVGNATAMAEMFEARATGQDVPQYGGSEHRREADIAAQAVLPAAELVELVRDSGARCLGALRAHRDWDGTLQWLSGRWPATRGPISRWREIEIHRVDLDRGYGCGDWSGEFVEFHLRRELPRLADRGPEVRPPDLPDAQLLGWLLGRGEPGLPQLPPWG